jgi:hypothetical protein
MSKYFTPDQPPFDWKDLFKCPKCKECHLDLKNEEEVCDKCGYRQPFNTDYGKVPPIMDG